MSWELHYSLNEHDANKWGVEPSSDTLGYTPFATLVDAQATAREICKDPESMGHCPWMSDATIWAEPVEN